MTSGADFSCPYGTLSAWQRVYYAAINAPQVRQGWPPRLLCSCRAETARFQQLLSAATQAHCRRVPPPAALLQWNGARQCGRCITARCVDSRCKVRDKWVTVYVMDQ